MTVNNFNLTTADYTPVSAFHLRMHINTVMSIAANALVIYLILRHSTASMKDYRWCLLDMNVCFLLFDLHMTVVWEPFPIYKSLSICTVGVANSLPVFPAAVVQLGLAAVIFGFCLGATFTAFLYRSLAVYNRLSLMTRPWFIVLVVLMHLLGTAPAAFSFVQPAFDGAYGLQRMDLITSGSQLQSYPCLMAKRGRPPIIIGITLAGEVVFWIGLIVGLPVVTFRKLKREQCRMSTRAYQVQRTLLVSLMVQVSLPALTMALPVVMIAVCLTFVSFDSSDIMALAFQIFTLHSFFNAVATIALTRPYREVVLRWLRLRKNGGKVKVISVVSHNSFTRRASEMTNARLADRRISSRPSMTVEAWQ